MSYSAYLTNNFQLIPQYVTVKGFHANDADYPENMEELEKRQHRRSDWLNVCSLGLL
jgi:hypothetical protein